MIIKEIILNPEPYQEILLPIGSNILKAIIKESGLAILLVEVLEEDYEDFNYSQDALDTWSIYIIPSNESFSEDIGCMCKYLSTLHMISSLGDIHLYHVYIINKSFLNDENY